MRLSFCNPMSIRPPGANLHLLQVQIDVLLDYTPVSVSVSSFISNPSLDSLSLIGFLLSALDISCLSLYFCIYIYPKLFSHRNLCSCYLSRSSLRQCPCARCSPWCFSSVRIILCLWPDAWLRSWPWVTHVAKKSFLVVSPIEKFSFENVCMFEFSSLWDYREIQLNCSYIY